MNFTRTFIYIRVMYYILHCITQLIRMHMYNTPVHDLFDVFDWLPWSNPFLRHQYGYNGVTPHPYVIAIYRTCLYYRLDIATWRSRDHDTFIFIVRVLLCKTIDDLSRWLLWSNPLLRHRYGYHGVTPHPYVIAIYSTNTLKPDNR